MKLTIPKVGEIWMCNRDNIAEHILRYTFYGIQTNDPMNYGSIKCNRLYSEIKTFKFKKISG